MDRCLSCRPEFDRISHMLPPDWNSPLVTHGLRSVFKIADELIACASEDEICLKAVEKLRAQLGIERCAIFLRKQEEMRGTYGTDRNGNTTCEHEYRFVPIAPNWYPRIEALRTEGIRWEIEEGPLSEWNGKESVKIGHGWVAFTPLFSKASSKLLGIFVNDTAITNTPVDPLKQDLLTVFCALLAGLIEQCRGDDRLRTANQEKTMVLATISHEFRTSLTPINGFSEMLFAHDRLTKEEREWITIIKQKSEDLVGLANDILHLARNGVSRPAFDSEAVPASNRLRGLSPVSGPSEDAQNLRPLEH